MPIASQRSRVVFQKLERDLVKLSSKPRAENVHRLRTGTRRLQILLGELSPQMDRNQKKLLKLLGRIRKRAGKVRDLDVQLAALRSLKIPREPRRKTQLMNDLIELRGRQEKKLQKAGDKSTVREVLKRLKRAAKDFKPEATRDPLTVANSMLQKIRRDTGPVTEAALHQYRILSKRARYAAEFAGQSAEAVQLIADIRRVQDALGDWHDWLTLTNTARQHLGEVRECSLVAELHNVTGAKFRHSASVLSHFRPAVAPNVKAPVPVRNRPAGNANQETVPAA
jgi:CHAD domain-containing protein